MTHHTTALTNTRVGTAARWFVRHESDDELSSAEWEEWQEWCADSDNCAEYEQVIRMHRETRSMARPLLPRPPEILADVAKTTGLRRLLVSGLSVRRSTYWFRLPITAAAVAGIVLTAVVIMLNGDRTRHQPRQAGANSFNVPTLESLRAAGHPVLINLRADWCGTCIANERTLSSEAVHQMMTRKRVAYLQGEWTDQNPDISVTIRRFGRAGVPLYLLYCPGSQEPKILPQILTEAIVLNALSPLPDQSEPPT